jgi:hypothetical protein
MRGVHLGDEGDEGKEPSLLRPRAVGDDDTGGGAARSSQILKSDKMAKNNTGSQKHGTSSRKLGYKGQRARCC